MATAPVNINIAKGERVYPFMKLKFLALIFSLGLFGASLYFVYTKGFNFGVDFAGGIKLVYQFSGPTSEDAIRSAMAGLDLGDAQVLRFGQKEDRSFLIKVREKPGVEVVVEITGQLKEKMAGQEITLLAEEFVGPRVGTELRNRGIWAIVISWILILIYVGWRFDFLFAPGAIIALIHDVQIAIGFLVFFGKEINLPILAAMLTIIGYSINDTIVIYDRIRENIKKMSPNGNLAQLIDLSLTQTLSRTLVTGTTTIFSLIVLFVLGGGVLHDFAFCMLVGVIAGTYSSLFVASPIYLACQKLFPNWGLVKGGGRR